MNNSDYCYGIVNEKINQFIILNKTELRIYIQIIKKANNSRLIELKRIGATVQRFINERVIKPTNKPNIYEVSNEFALFEMEDD